MARAMGDLLLDADLRTRMERLGLQRSKDFSWQKTAQKTLDIYYEVAGANGHARAKAKPAQAVR